MIKSLVQKYSTPQGLWRIFCMTAAIFLMGFSLSFLILVDMGTDPFTCMNLGFASVLHLSFGNWQMLLNLALFIVTLVCKRNLIGLGTFVNMIAIGYTADFFGALWSRTEVLSGTMSLTLRLVILVCALVVFVASAAIYMTAELGTAPWDAIPFIIAEKLGKIPFRWVRMCWDTMAVLLGMAMGRKVGVITIAMVLTLGPVVEWFGKHVTKKLLGLVK